MNLDNLSDLPEWDEVYIPFLEADKNGEERPSTVTCEAGQALYAQWRQVLIMIKGAFDLEDIGLDKDAVEDMKIFDMDSDPHDYWVRIRAQIISDSYDVGQQIVDAEIGIFYVIKMERAVAIRKNVLLIDNCIWTLMGESGNLIENSHGTIIREEIDQFRILFKYWVSTFEKDEAYTDDWGLFI